MRLVKELKALTSAFVKIVPLTVMYSGRVMLTDLGLEAELII